MRHRIFIVLLASLLSVVACSVRPQPDGVCEKGTMVFVPEGWFLMGQDHGRRSHQPQRRVYLDRYVIDCTEVTNEAFGAFVEETGYEAFSWNPEFAAARGVEPVTGVLWREARACCQWMGKRLPTEAEWEKAARGTDGRRYPWGELWDSSRANTVEAGIGGVVPVGSYPEGASPYGVLDMAGNAAEWVADTFDPAYYA